MEEEAVEAASGEATVSAELGSNADNKDRPPSRFLFVGNGLYCGDGGAEEYCNKEKIRGLIVPRTCRSMPMPGAENTGAENGTAENGVFSPSKILNDLGENTKKFGKEADQNIQNAPVSYTHLTLPTILLV